MMASITRNIRAPEVRHTSMALKRDLVELQNFAMRNNTTAYTTPLVTKNNTSATQLYNRRHFNIVTKNNTRATQLYNRRHFNNVTKNNTSATQLYNRRHFNIVTKNNTSATQLYNRRHFTGKFTISKLWKGQET